MQPLDRRSFLAGLAGSLVSASALARKPGAPASGQSAAKPAPQVTGKQCWLDVCAPFVVEDPALGLSTDILLTATCFPGIEGFRDPQYATEYELHLYDARGRELNLGSAGRMVVPALRPTLLRIGELAGQRSFWGSAKVRLIPRGNQVTHAGDLFSAGFVRWNFPGNFDNVHAHPRVPRDRWFYSMPFPALDDYHCTFALFNPNEEVSEGIVRLMEPLGQSVAERRYKLRPRQTILYSLADLRTYETPAEALALAPAPAGRARGGGVVMVANRTEEVAFAYTLMKSRQGGSFSVEHPLHFADKPVGPGRRTPYRADRSFPAEALLYTPLLFAGRRIGGLELESRLYLSASRWREEDLWLMPFVTDARGMIAWVSNRDERFPERVAPREVTSQGLVRLGFFQSCRLNARELPLEQGFAGGFGVATIPPTSHSLMKVEVRATNWDRAAFTHFRPGGHFHKRYRTVAERGGLATDYIVAGCQVNRTHECLMALMNIEFEEEKTGSPKIQLFGASGMVAEKALGEFPPLACRHLLVSEVFPDVETRPGQPLTVRMLDAGAMMVVSALHIDAERRDIALEHGSDRHSTYLDYGC